MARDRSLLAVRIVPVDRVAAAFLIEYTTLTPKMVQQVRVTSRLSGADVNRERKQFDQVRLGRGCFSVGNRKWKSLL
jgi:hypothetical protein